MAPTCSADTGRTVKGGPDADGWWPTGDVAYADADGDLFLVDRLGEMIIVSGFNVYPHEVELVLAAHPGVAEAAVVGMPHPYTGESVKAYVVPAAGATCTAEDLVAHCERNLARFKCPTVIEFVAGLPHSATGKVQKSRLIGQDSSRDARLTLITRVDCHLCDVAKEALARVAGRPASRWTEVDVDSDPALHRGVLGPGAGDPARRQGARILAGRGRRLLRDLAGIYAKGTRRRTSAKLERLVRAAQAESRIPALSVALHRADRPLWTFQVGTSGSEVALSDAGTLFRIGSVTKTFAAVMVMQCRDDGLLDLDDPSATHLPGVAHGGLTVRRLLSHTSGMQREPFGDVWDTLELPDGHPASWTTWPEIEQVLPPARRFHYSNVGLAILGHLVARLRGAEVGPRCSTTGCC